MESTISVSKGCFVFKNGATRADKSVTKRTKRQGSTSSGVLAKDTLDQPFYQTYSKTWNSFMEDINRLQQSNYNTTIEDLVAYVTNLDLMEACQLGEIVPAVALLTGINQPDHMEHFESLSQRIQTEISASVCMLSSRDCPTVKTAIENMVHHFIESKQDDEEEDRDRKRLRRSQHTMRQLLQWYCNNYNQAISSVDDEDGNEDSLVLPSVLSDVEKHHLLIVVLPDFESFNAQVLQDLIRIMSSYCLRLPFVLILGVATSISTIHNILPYHVSCKIQLKVFQTPTAPVCLNEILDKVILSPKYAFHLSGKAMKFLSHVFLYYDFSINGFIQGFKYCLMEHFIQSNAFSLCCEYSTSLTKIKDLMHDDMEAIRRLLSFRPYVEGINNCKRIISILTDDNYLKKKLPQLLHDCHVFFMMFRTFLEFLTVLVEDLPKYPLGKYRRELYSLCLSKDIAGETTFKESWQLLSFMSKDEFVCKMLKAVKTTKKFLSTNVAQLELGGDCVKVVNEELEAVKELVAKVAAAGMESTPAEQTSPSTEELKQMTRRNLKEKLTQMSKKEKPISEFNRAVNDTLTFILEEIIKKYLRPLSSAPPLHELFVFGDISTVRRHIIGAPRAALHLALNNPHYYLQCKCCSLPEESRLLATLPDLSVAYKLHLECGRMINLFDWLQAFRSIVDPNEDDQEQVDPTIQARFTRAVAELQFLGYIKMSKRKTDHATRLTW